MNLFAEHKQIHNRLWKKKLMVTKGNMWGLGRIRGLGLAHAHGGIWNAWLTGNFRITEAMLPSIL